MASGGEEHGRRILSYWTADRMQSAQPEPSPDYEAAAATAMTDAHARDILAYWTPERMASAQPEELVYGEHVEDDAVVGAARAAGSLRIVGDGTVVTFPYQSVGKLFYTKVNSSGVSRNSYASAWVANISTQLHVVMTAAHCLAMGDERATDILFVPGYIPPNTRPFGSYPQIPGGNGVAWWVDPNWDPNHIQAKYDVGMIKLGKDPGTGNYVDEVVISIQLKYNQSYTARTQWNTLGYPSPSSGNPDGKMCERSGTFYKVDDSTVYKYGTLPGGTSGGPWILASPDGAYNSNGVQAGNTKSGTQCALTPYFKSTPEELAALFA